MTVSLTYFSTLFDYFCDLVLHICFASTPLCGHFSSLCPTWFRPPHFSHFSVAASVRCALLIATVNTENRLPNFLTLFVSPLCTAWPATAMCLGPHAVLSRRKVVVYVLLPRQALSTPFALQYSLWSLVGEDFVACGSIVHDFDSTASCQR